MDNVKLQLISFKICPFVQRTVITLREKGVDFDITYIDLVQRPAWFKDISPLGKVPVLRVGETSLFESAVINEYLDEVYAPKLHPEDPLRRAHNRAWIEFASVLTQQQYQLGLAADKAGVDAQCELLDAGLKRLDNELGSGPFFNGADFSLVDASLAPVFMRLAIFDQHIHLDLYAARPRLAAYRDALLSRPSVADSVVPEFTELFVEYFRGRGGYVAGHLPATTGAIRPSTLHQPERNPRHASQ
jgi:glutathione S-transferase